MDRGDFDINLLALRNSTRDWRNYDDILYAMYREDGEWVVEQFSVTTEPQAGVLRGAVWAERSMESTCLWIT